MNVRPAPHTPYERKLRLAEEQAFYERFGDDHAPLAALRGVISPLANGLEALSHLLRALAAADRQHAA